MNVTASCGSKVAGWLLGLALTMAGCGPAISQTGDSGDASGTDTEAESASASNSASGGTSSTGTDPTSATGSGTSGTSVTSTSGASATNTDTGGSGDPTTGGPICDAYFSEDVTGPNVEVIVVNETGAPVFYYPQGCGGSVPIGLRDPEGEPFSTDPGDCFPQLCEEFLEQGDCGQACPDCAAPPIIRIEPDGRFSMVWGGARYDGMQMVEECGSCTGPCLRRSQASAGTYVADVAVMGACEGNCECPGEPTPQGVCATDYDNILSEPLQVEASFVYPGESTVMLILQ